MNAIEHFCVLIKSAMPRIIIVYAIMKCKSDSLKIDTLIYVSRYIIYDVKSIAPSK